MGAAVLKNAAFVETKKSKKKSLIKAITVTNNLSKISNF